MKELISEQMSFTIDEVRKLTGLGRTKIYEEMKAGNLPAKKWGRKTVILKKDLESFLSNLADYPVVEEV